MGTPEPDTSERAASGLMPRGSYLLALLVLAGSLILVLLAWYYARERELRAAQARFEAHTAEIADRLDQRLAYYELVARGGTALFASMARPTPQQWADYVGSMSLHPRFPAVKGLGFVGYVSSNRLDDLQIEWRESGYGQLNVRPHGMRARYAPILYLEPRTVENVAVVGLDLFETPAGKEALQSALETGTARLSSPASGDDGALMLFIPVYRAGDRPRTAAARELSMQGWVYLPFDIGRHVDASLGSEYGELGLRIFDVGQGDRLVFARKAADPDALFHHQATLDVYGRRWRLEFDSPPEAVAAPRLKGLENMLALGLFASLLMYGIAWSLARTEDRANVIARRMTEDYRRSEQRFRSSMTYSAIGKALLDSEGRIVEANPALGRIVGSTVESLVGRTFESLFEEGDFSQHDDGVTDADGVHRVTRHLRREGDLPRQAQLTFAPVHGKVGQDITGLVQVEDVTERVRAQARVQALNRTLEARVAMRTRELSQANQELEAFAYSVSHDLRAPLRSIDGFSRVLIERYEHQLDEGGRDYLRRVRKAAMRMGELIDAILQISRLGRAALQRESVDLSRMALEVVDELRAGDPGRELAVRVMPGLAAVGDAALLRNLLGNLLGNAWKFTRGREQAMIEFGAVDLPGDETEFYVRDNGAGFAQVYVDKLFRPFQRLHQQEEFSGHGIGLASVRRIVERHGGRIRAEGREGEGAVFYFTLPEAGEPAAMQSPAPPA
ncbi:CHASE domain-containing protein [Lysobacter solisilvae (ex Woo and Kim 2020)]|uniref:histidine kinase n=1 Tax=Agrilutibacter terrestris TaxID=2865112 RepID=A0A7H0FXJ5_9GAMM|nr:CHASE domain-containing protein [Lysobacter terrestris]QNP40761.1 CHASE domain-containing protein [Lysobacter terrestris]